MRADSAPLSLSRHPSYGFMGPVYVARFSASSLIPCDRPSTQAFTDGNCMGPKRQVSASYFNTAVAAPIFQDVLL